MNSIFPRLLRRCVVFLVLVLSLTLGMAEPAWAAHHRHGHAARAQGGHAHHRSRAARSRVHARAAAPAPRARHGSKYCYAKVRRHGRLVRVRKPCGESEQVLTNSPLQERALDESTKTAGDKAPGDAVVSGKGRTSVIRAYAVDGTTFFHNGRKIHIEGLSQDDNAGLTHELATQKLQRLLDSGAVSVDPIAADETGAMRAFVKIDGRNVADLMKAGR